MTRVVPMTRLSNFLLAPMCVGLIAVAVSVPARAQDSLDSVRRTDLNDYALGVAMSISENPFVGADRSTIVFPYLTALQNPAFNKDWFLIRDGERIGVKVCAPHRIQGILRPRGDGYRNDHQAHAQGGRAENSIAASSVQPWSSGTVTFGARHLRSLSPFRFRKL